MLTKEQIEAIEIGGRDDEWEMSGDLSMDDARELRRLALLGIEREERAERVGLAVLHWVADETPQSIHKDSERMAKRGLPAYALLLASIAAAMEDEA